MFVILAIMNNTTLYAHGVVSQQIGSGKVKFLYDDDTPLANGYVTVYGADGNEIATGQTDADGVFDYTMYENAAKVSISDVYGHHLTHEIGVSQNRSTEHHDHHSPGTGNSFFVTVTVVAVLAAVAVLFSRRRKS